MNLAENTAPSKTASREESNQVICLAVVPKAGFRIDAEVVQFPIYWVQTEQRIEKEEFPNSPLSAALQDILIDPLLEEMWLSIGGTRKSWVQNWKSNGFHWFAERQFLPGVTDNLSRTVEEALVLEHANKIRVASGTGYLFTYTSERDQEEIEEFGKYRLFHPLTDRFVVHDLSAIYNRYLGFPAVHLPEVTPPQEIPLDLDDEGLMKLSRDRLLALNIAEMKAIKAHFEDPAQHAKRAELGLPKWPTDVEIEVIAQTWSEHCKHKIFGAKISHKDKSKAGKSLEIDSLYKTYIQGPTYELMKKRDDLLSVFEDNSGVVRWNKDQAVCFKVETHNSPSALEPYGGALTGILGVNRDVLGTGLGAKPIFNTDIFCFAYPSALLADRPKLLPPETIIQGVRRGVQDGGNKSGIPTVNGAIFFHPGYRAKPLVFCGTGGILPIEVAGKSGIDKHTKVGDTIVVVGGKVGKDGIHGATFSSEALHEGSPVTAVQIGDPFTQKRVLDFVLEARDRGLITGITDNGAGGLSSSVGEMGRITNGAHMEIENIPLKYPGLADYEIVISESQERMTISTDKLEELEALARKFNVEATAIGTFTEDGFFKVTRTGKTVACLDLTWLHKGVPRLELESEWNPTKRKDLVGPEVTDLNFLFNELLSHPNVCSREYVIRQYDHEVQGASVVKPLMGATQKAPCDAAVIKPILSENAGLAVSNGVAPQLSEFDAYVMAQCAVDEAVRNAVCVGADPSTIVLLDNFCWPDPVVSERNKDGKFKLAQLVRTCQGLSDMVLAYGTPLISGKDSMKNDFDDGTVRLSIPPTLLVSAMGKVPDIEKAITMEFKSDGDLVYVVCAATLGLAGSLLAEVLEWQPASLPQIEPLKAAHMYKHLHEAIKNDLVKSTHDLSEGGLGVALAECCLGSGFGARILTHRIATAAMACIEDTNPLTRELLTRIDFALFAEGPARILVTVAPENQKAWEELMADFSCVELGKVTKNPSLTFFNANQAEVFSVPVADLTSAWEAMLPFNQSGEEE